MSIDATNALLRFARRWFDERTVTSVFEPLLADHQRLWLDAPPASRLRISIKTAAAFVTALMWTAPRAVMLAPVPVSTTRRVIARVIIFTGIYSGLLTVPIVMNARSMSPFDTVIAALFILPSGIAIAFPFSMLWAADGIRKARVATPAERAAALRLGMVAVIFMVGLMGWGVPAANQLYREVAAPEYIRRPLPRGLKEATIGELLSKQPPRLVDARSPANLQREGMNRIVLAVLPAILLWFRWTAHEGRRKRWWSTPPIAAETIVLIPLYFWIYFQSFFLELRTGMPPGSTLWLPLLVLIALGILRRSLTNGVAA